MIESFLWSFKSFTSAINFFVITLLRPRYLNAFRATSISLIKINLVVTKSSDYRRSKATNIIDHLKSLSGSFKKLKVFLEQRSILVTFFSFIINHMIENWSVFNCISRIFNFNSNIFFRNPSFCNSKDELFSYNFKLTGM